jgi:hypothetical protein
VGGKKRSYSAICSQVVYTFVNRDGTLDDMLTCPWIITYPWGKKHTIYWWMLEPPPVKHPLERYMCVTNIALTLGAVVDISSLFCLGSLKHAHVSLRSPTLCYSQPTCFRLLSMPSLHSFEPGVHYISRADPLSRNWATPS